MEAASVVLLDQNPKRLHFTARLLLHFTTCHGTAMNRGLCVRETQSLLYSGLDTWYQVLGEFIYADDYEQESEIEREMWNRLRTWDGKKGRFWPANPTMTT